jgi:glycosyltransferase involved in cell wall biosynthesis
MRLAERKVHSRVSFLGHVADPSSCYRRAHIHVAPSLWEEPSANVVFEAKRHGAPSIVFDSGGLAELVHHKIDGYICETKTAKSLASAILWMLSDNARLSALAAAARLDSETRFGRSRFLEAWADVYLADARRRA